MADADLMEEVSQAVRQAAKLPADRIVAPESRLVEDLGIDSLDLVGVVLQVQDRFGIELPDDDVARVRTVADLATSVAERQTVAA